ncbi:MAG TPA: heparinase II/III family protein, partial [Phycisphaerae bacterium]|nr:heparinase II/III family protein [Phycisphaerae bacterium]
SLVWLDPTRSGGSIDRLAKTAFFPDLGLALVRDGWDANDCAAMFKCSPYGGAKLNEYRNANDFHYVNVAHDDPDINSFQLYARGATLAETSRYSKKKLTSSHNTILVGGKGQRGEGQGWTQPLGRGDKDMTHLAWVTAWKDAGDVAVVEGEGGGAYPDLDRYRRTFVWVKGAYVLVLDDIRAAGDKDVELAWLVQGPQLTTTDEAAGRYILSKAGAQCEFQVACQPPLAGSVGVSTADNRGKPLGWQQLRLTGKAGAFRVASAYDLWARGEVGVEMTPGDDGAVAVRVRARGVDDTWTWRPAGPRAPSSLTGARSGKAFVAVTEKDAPPAP